MSIYRNEEGQPPSLLVEDGETVTISLRDADETGLHVVRMRPRTTAALLVLAGHPPRRPRACQTALPSNRSRVPRTRVPRTWSTSRSSTKTAGSTATAFRLFAGF